MASFSLYKVILKQSNTPSLTALPDFCFVANSPVAKENANEIMKIMFNSDMICFLVVCKACQFKVDSTFMKTECKKISNKFMVNLKAITKQCQLSSVPVLKHAY